MGSTYHSFSSPSWDVNKVCFDIMLTKADFNILNDEDYVYVINDNKIHRATPYEPFLGRGRSDAYVMMEPLNIRDNLTRSNISVSYAASECTTIPELILTIAYVLAQDIVVGDFIVFNWDMFTEIVNHITTEIDGIQSRIKLYHYNTNRETHYKATDIVRIIKLRKLGG